MPTRKQRRRRQKEHRHHYEYVYVDDEGREVEPPEEVQPAERTNGKEPTARRGRRKVEPPSWSRVGKRALWVGPLMFVTLSLVAGELPIQQRILETLMMLGIFLPVSYMMDRTIWRTAVRRGAAVEQPKKR